MTGAQGPRSRRYEECDERLAADYVHSMVGSKAVSLEVFTVTQNKLVSRDAALLGRKVSRDGALHHGELSP